MVWKWIAFGNQCQEPPLRENAKFVSFVWPTRKSESSQCFCGRNHCFWYCLVLVKTNYHRKWSTAGTQSLWLISGYLKSWLTTMQTSFLYVLYCNYIAYTTNNVAAGVASPAGEWSLLRCKPNILLLFLNWPGIMPAILGTVCYKAANLQQTAPVNLNARVKVLHTV